MDFRGTYDFSEPDTLSGSSRTDESNSDQGENEEESQSSSQSICSSARRANIASKFHEILEERPHEALQSMGNYRLDCMLQDFEEVEAKRTASMDASTDERSLLAHTELKSAEKTTQTSAAETQCVSTETESTTACVETKTVCQDQKENYSETIRTPISPASKARKRSHEYQRLLQHDDIETQCVGADTLDRSSMQRNIDDYMKKAEEMNNCFISTQSRYREEQNIIGECANFINVIESLKSTDDKNDLTEHKKILTNYRTRLTSVHIQIMKDRQSMINVEKQYQKILSDYRHLALDLDSVRLENEKLGISFKNQLKSREEEYEALKKENAFLKSGFDKIRVDLDYFTR